MYHEDCVVFIYKIGSKIISLSETQCERLTFLDQVLLKHACRKYPNS